MYELLRLFMLHLFRWPVDEGAAWLAFRAEFFVFSRAAVLIFRVHFSVSARVGGLGALKEGDEVAQGIALKALSAIEARINTAFEMFHVVQYATQTVAGKNYFLKIDTGSNFLHARVFVGFDGAAQLHSVRYPKTDEDALEYFEADAIVAAPAVRQAPAGAGPRPGGLKSKPADDEIRAIALAVKDSLEAALKTTYSEYEPFEYATQLVAGMNYFIKLFVGSDDFLHVRVFKSLDGQLSLVRVFPGRTAESPLEYF